MKKLAVLAPLILFLAGLLCLVLVGNDPSPAPPEPGGPESQAAQGTAARESSSDRPPARREVEPSNLPLPATVPEVDLAGLPLDRRFTVQVVDSGVLPLAGAEVTWHNQDLARLGVLPFLPPFLDRKYYTSTVPCLGEGWHDG